MVLLSESERGKYRNSFLLESIASQYGIGSVVVHMSSLFDKGRQSSGLSLSYSSATLSVYKAHAIHSAFVCFCTRTVVKASCDDTESERLKV